MILNEVRMGGRATIKVTLSVAQIKNFQTTRWFFFRILLLGGPSPPSQLVPNPFNWSPNIVFTDNSVSVTQIKRVWYQIQPPSHLIWWMRFQVYICHENFLIHLNRNQDFCHHPTLRYIVHEVLCQRWLCYIRCGAHIEEPGVFQLKHRAPTDGILILHGTESTKVDSNNGVVRACLFHLANFCPGVC